MGGFGPGDGGGGDGGGTLPPGSDSDFADFTSTPEGKQIWSVIEAGVKLGTLPGALADIAANKSLAGLAAALKVIWDALLKVEKLGVEEATPVLKAIVELATTLLVPIAEVFGVASKAYVTTIGTSIAQKGDETTDVSGVGEALGARYAFDSIVAPIAFVASKNDPTRPGAGAANIQSSLGAIVSIHLMTWVINVVSNLTGVGALKFMNSFNEVLLAAMNARGMARVAMKPYLTKFMEEPATQELNYSWPTKGFSEGSAIKAFLRGAITDDDLNIALRKAGYSDDKALQFLEETQKRFSDADVGTLVTLGWWTEEQAIMYVQQSGWSEELAPVVVRFERQRRVRTIQGDIAARAEALLVTGQLTEDVFAETLHDLNFSDAEVEALTIKATLAKAAKNKLSLTQVKQLFEADLVDLNYVLAYLEGLGFDLETSNLLVLLEFTVAKDRHARRAVLAANARLQAAKEREAAAIAANKNLADISAADLELAKKKQALAAALGG